MPETIEIDGEEYALRGNPSMGTVKYVQEMQIDILRNYLDDEDIMQMDSMDNDQVMEILLEKEGGLNNLKDLMWENNLLATAQTIILATDHQFGLSQFEDLAALEFMDLKEQSEQSLGTKENPQSAADFMARLGIGISSQVKEIQAEAEKKVADSQTSSQSPLLSE